MLERMKELATSSSGIWRRSLSRAGGIWRAAGAGAQPRYPACNDRNWSSTRRRLGRPLVDVPLHNDRRGGPLDHDGELGIRSNWLGFGTALSRSNPLSLSPSLTTRSSLESLRAMAHPSRSGYLTLVGYRNRCSGQPRDVPRFPVKSFSSAQPLTPHHPNRALSTLPLPCTRRSNPPPLPVQVRINDIRA
jgi:hypothetical protein